MALQDDLDALQAAFDKISKAYQDRIKERDDLQAQLDTIIAPDTSKVIEIATAINDLVDKSSAVIIVPGP